jgi:tetratricopeptide (TPR) repeat protein
LSAIAIYLGKYQQALSLARECEIFLHDFNNIYSLYGSGSLIDALYAVGEYDEAEELCQRVLSYFKERGAFHTYCWLFWLGKLAFKKDEYERAEKQFQESLVIAYEAEDPEVIALAHDALGRLKLNNGEVHLARKHLQSALETAISLSRPPILLAIITTAAELFAEEGDQEYAALLAILTAYHSASQASVKERAEELLTRLEAQLGADDLVEIRQRSQQSDLDSLAHQLLIDLAG